MIVTGRTAAKAIMFLAGLALAALGITATATGRVTGHEALGFFAALLIGTAAALWYRREKRNGDAP